ncbi:MAG: YqgE/AlgH family protein [Verrucomicrobiales bacterium]|nr:YqgE/AlgH family protein [Verrucomicrobiales bacterium]
MPTTEENNSHSLQGSILLAAPSLREPTFRHSVLLLTEHSENEGAHGYILNRPLGKTVGDLLPDEAFDALADVPVFIGGPVSTEHLTFGSLAWSEEIQNLQFTSHLSAKQALRQQNEGFSIRAFVGYSGWGEGQLEAELKQSTWITHKPEKRVLDLEQLDSLWTRLLKEMSPWHALLADEPDDVSLN